MPGERPTLILPKSTAGRGWTLPQVGSAGRSFTRQPGAVSHLTEQLSVWPPKAEEGALTHSLDLGSLTTGSCDFSGGRFIRLLDEVLPGGMWQVETPSRIYKAVCGDVLRLWEDLRHKRSQRRAGAEAVWEPPPELREKGLDFLARKWEGLRWEDKSQCQISLQNC